MQSNNMAEILNKDVFVYIEGLNDNYPVHLSSAKTLLKIVLVENSGLKIENGVITGEKAGCDKGLFREKIANKDGITISYVGTGGVVELRYNDLLLDSAVIMIKGDVDGDGVRDYERQDVVSYETSAFNEVRNKFCSVSVKTEKHPATGKNTISVRGDFGEGKRDVNVCYVENSQDENVLYNVMTRDIEYSGENVSTSSYAVVHKLYGDNFLVYGGEGGIYDAVEGKFIR
jgi:hypothetical protein